MWRSWEGKASEVCTTETPAFQVSEYSINQSHGMHTRYGYSPTQSERVVGNGNTAATLAPFQSRGFLDL